ncbi:calpain-A-like isoform X2 [Ruditapes philippinarum]|uniref:calpain-A-like isoform X2 n=1 Tax=Ruditapes philippinarum TaxID=129788 RepID=UPI00295AE5F2|nr:calpain-A-like isoform X2 [Ruditapes philippinarum]
MDSKMSTPRRSVGRSDSFKSLNHTLNRSYQSIISSGNKVNQYDTLRERALARRVLYEDPAFPAHDTSLQIRYNSTSDFIEWKRPHEISKRPSFISKNPGTFDIIPGNYGDTWLVPAFSCLTLAPALIQKCIPEDQAFDEKYGGIFRFRFWRYAEWIEIVIDDRLPTYNGRILFTSSMDPNEFWVPLLEKAYAKMYGSYAAIQGSMVNWALQDLTGGIVDTFIFRDNLNLLQKIIDFSMARTTLIAATIAGQGVSQGSFSNGLVAGRAYSVTGYAEVPFQGSSAILVRLRNPWGTSKYTGPWNARSSLWDALSPGMKAKLGYGQLKDNEFWMPYADFARVFTNLELCHLPPEAWNLEPKLKHRLPWKSVEAHRQWRRGYNAGGGIHSQLMSCNNQFYLELKKSTGVVLSLMQKYRLFGEVREFVPCGCIVFEAPPGQTSRLGMGHFVQAKQITSTGVRAERENVRFLTLPAGSYVIVPVTGKVGVEGKFCLRILCDNRDIVVRELDDIDTANFSPQIDQKLDPETLYVLRKRFSMFCNRYEEVDGYGLRQILSFKPQSGASMILCCEPEKDEMHIKRLFLSPETSKAAVTIEDKDMNGRLNFEEFLSLVQKLSFWQSIFLKFSVGNGSVMDSYSLRNAFRIAGFSVSNKIMEALVLRFAAKDFIHLEGFMNSIIKLHVAHRITTSNKDRHSRAAQNLPAMSDEDHRKYLQELLRTSIYS